MGPDFNDLLISRRDLAAMVSEASLAVGKQPLAVSLNRVASPPVGAARVPDRKLAAMTEAPSADLPRGSLLDLSV